MTDLTSRLSTALTDRYRIERLLGEGGMAIVYLAEDLKHQRKVALKVLRPELAAVLGAERFLREITITANLRHPHILPLYDSGRASVPPERGTGGEATSAAGQDFLYYVMPYIEGESLRDRLVRERQLPVGEAVDIAAEVGDALAYAHARGVIHRDIKPENILLESGHAVVADFGIAFAVSAAGGEKLTQTGISVGTPAYMSPEQAGGASELDGRSDLYALACVLYEMLGGQPPFTGPTVESLVHQHLAVDPPPVTNLRPTVPAPLASALQTGLAKSPADRFTAVTQFVTALRAESAISPVPTTSPSASRRRRIYATAVAVTLTAVILAFAVLRGRPDIVLPTGSISSLAVLPLENLSAEPGQEYFVDGMTDALITELSKIEALRIISRTSAMQYRGTGKPLQEIADELRVDGIVEGSVLRDGNRVRISAQLIDVARDRNVWADAYDRDMNDVLALHGDVARAIAGEIRVVLTEADEARLTRAHPVDREAHDLLLRGRYQWRRGARQEAVRLLEAATEADPEYAVAWAELGVAIAFLAREEPSLLPRARSAVQRAVQLDPNLPEVQGAVGEIALTHDWDWDTAQRALTRAIELNPGYEDAHENLGDYYEILGKWDEAIAEGIRSEDVNPLSIDMRMNLGLTYSYAGRYDAAIAECRDALELDSLSSWVYFCLADAYLRKGVTSEAVATAEKAFDLDSTDMNRAMLARVFALSGQRNLADSIVGSLESAEEHRYVSPWLLAWIHVGLGNTDRALDFLERAVAEHAAYTPLANSLTDFDGVRSRPRFQRLLDQLNLKPDG